MPILIMTVGLPGSGKSTLAHKLAKQYKAEVFSSDALRKELYGSEAVQEHNEKVFDILTRRMIEALKEGKSVVFDAMNISSKNRRHTLRILSKYVDKKIAFLLATPFEMCLERNNSRERHVPEEVIKRAYMNFTVPCVQEGFDEVNLIYPDGFDTRKYIAKKYDECDIPHDNKHHVYGVLEHMFKAGRYYVNTCRPENYDKVLMFSTFLHDIGKPFCKTFVNYKGEKTEDAHYYGHEHVGAYLSLFYTELSPKDRIESALMIQYHMNYYTSWNKSEKAKQRDKDFLGSELFEKIEKLHECDIEAHHYDF